MLYIDLFTAKKTLFWCIHPDHDTLRPPLDLTKNNIAFIHKQHLYQRL